MNFSLNHLSNKNIVNNNELNDKQSHKLLKKWSEILLKTLQIVYKKNHLNLKKNVMEKLNSVYIKAMSLIPIYINNYDCFNQKLL